MEKKLILGFVFAIFMIASINLVSADFFYSPMNFQPGEFTNHTINVTLNGSINVTLPNNFTLLSGSLSGTNNVFAIVQSPNVSDESLHIGTISLNGTHYDNMYFISIADNKIVDNKIELGHGDFNYIDADQEIGDGQNLLFSLVRVWGIGSDIFNEPAKDVNFNCTYPMILPRTVDSKYTSEYNVNNLTVQGELSRLEGISMFRVFVMSQEVDGEVGENYEVTCTDLQYSFSNTEIIASIPQINLSIRSEEPLTIAMQNNSGYVTYTFHNNETYDLRDVEFVWKSGTNTVREELNTMESGETVQYNIYTLEDEGTFSLEANFIPEWMFNSRSPNILTQTSFDMFDTNTITTLIDWTKIDELSYQTVVQLENLNTTVGTVAIPIYNSMGFSIDDIKTASCVHNDTTSVAEIVITEEAIILECQKLFYPGQNTTFEINVNSDTDDLDFIRMALGEEVCFNDLNSTNYYNNQSILTPVVLETTQSTYQIQTLQSPPSGNTYQLTYYFFDDGVLSFSQTEEITGIGVHDITFVPDLDPLSGEKDYDVFSKVRMLNDDGLLQCFDSEYIGQQTIVALSRRVTSNILYDVIVDNVYDRYSNDETISADITIKNVGDVPDEDTVLTYWLEDSEGNIFGETTEQFLEMPIGSTILRKSITLPQNAEAGDWSFKARYETVVQPTIEVKDGFTVITGYSVSDKVGDRWSTYLNENYRSMWFWFIVVIVGLSLIALIFSKRTSKQKKYKPRGKLHTEHPQNQFLR